MTINWLARFRRAKKEHTLDVLYSRALAHAESNEKEKERVLAAHDIRLKELIAQQF